MTFLNKEDNELYEKISEVPCLEVESCRREHCYGYCTRMHLRRKSNAWRLAEVCVNTDEWKLIIEEE